MGQFFLSDNGKTKRNHLQFNDGQCEKCPNQVEETTEASQLIPVPYNSNRIVRIHTLKLSKNIN